MSYKLKVSRPGYDVKSCTDEQLAFSSDWDSIKAYAIAETNVTLSSGNTTASVEVNHSLGYVPAYFVLANGNASVWTPLPYYGASTGVSLFSRIDSIVPYMTSTKLHIDVSGSAVGADVPINFKYFIFYNQLD